MRIKIALAGIVFVLISSLIFVTKHSSPADELNQKITLTIFAASSLSQTFTAIAHEFEQSHPGVVVRFSFLSSSTLASQIVSGAPVDIFASASEVDMVRAVGRIPRSVDFAANHVVLATPKSNEFHIAKIVDLNRKGLKWIQCAPSAPCGVASDRALSFEPGMFTKPVSREPNVSSVVAKLVTLEVDAAIIYHTDYVANKNILREIEFRNLAAATTKYPIGAVKDSKHASLAKSFVDSVLSPSGSKIMLKAGFDLPPIRP